MKQLSGKHFSKKKIKNFFENRDCAEKVFQMYKFT